MLDVVCLTSEDNSTHWAGAIESERERVRKRKSTNKKYNLETVLVAAQFIYAK